MFIIASFVLFTRMSLVPIIISVVRCFGMGLSSMRCLVVNILSGASILHCGRFFSIWAMVFGLLESARIRISFLFLLSLSRSSCFVASVSLSMVCCSLSSSAFILSFLMIMSVPISLIMFSFVVIRLRLKILFWALSPLISRWGLFLFLFFLVVLFPRFLRLMFPCCAFGYSLCTAWFLILSGVFVRSLVDR